MKLRTRLPRFLLLLALTTPTQAQWSTANLAVPRSQLCSTTVGGKAFFAGGYIAAGTTTNAVEIYDSSTGAWSLTALSTPRGWMAAGAVGNKALFAGGTNGSTPRSHVDVYDATTGAWLPTAYLSVERYGLAAATLGSQLYFAGGWGNSGASAVIDVYDDSTGTWSTGSLSQARTDLAGATVGTKILFAGGWTNSAPTDRVDIFDGSSWSVAHLSKARGRLCAVTLGDRVFFAGGESVGLGDEDVVDVYDDSTGAWSATTLSAPREFLAAAAVGNQVLFAGGWDGVTGGPSPLVDIYDERTGVWSTTTRPARWGMSATTVAGRALFAGGADTSMVHTRVDIYEPPNIFVFCTGDPGSGAPCPCGNDNDGTVPMSGCANGVHTSGARMTWVGEARLSADTLVLQTTGTEPSNSGLYFQADNELTPALPWGDGLRCAGGQLRRLGVRISNGAGDSDTSGFALPISVKAGNVSAGDTKFYQCWYRNPLGSPCSSEFNTSNGVGVTWLP